MESLSKNKIKWIRSLRLKKNRDKEGFFVIEGEKIVTEILENHPQLIELICSTDINFKAKVPCFHIDEREMKEISAFTTPNRLLAVVRFPQYETREDTLVLALDGVQDPGNLGTIIRTADWFGVDRIVCSKETADAFHPKVVQATMGSIFRIPIETVDLTDYLKKTTLPVYGALLEGNSLHVLDFEEKGVVVMGNEGQGISPSVQSLIQQSVHIPQYGGAESLNVAIATGILLAEFRRPINL